MDVIERIDYSSSAESDVSEVDDSLSIVSNDDDRESSRESDVTTTSTSTTSRTRSTGSASNSTTPTSSGVSLLSVLKAPSASDFSRKRKIAKNPPAGRKRALHSNSQSNPKTIKPQQRVTEYSKEPFTVATGKLFCQGCREELPLKKSSIEYHLKSTKHANGKKKLQQRNVKDSDIAQSLQRYNAEAHGRGETLPEQQQVFRVKVVKTFLQAGVPLSKVDQFRSLFEETGYRLTDRRFMFDLIPFILEEEKARIKQSLQGQFLSVIFDGTSHSGEALAVLVRFVNDSFEIQQQLLAIQLLSKSLTGEEIAHELVQVLSVFYSISSSHLIAAMRDRASVNSVAMRTLKIVYPNVIDIGCFSHAFDRVGEHFKVPTLTEFIGNWLALFSHSIKAKFLWKQQTGKAMASYSATRWWSKWEIFKQIMLQFGDIEPFLSENTDLGPASRPKLLAILTDREKLEHLKLELAAVIDWGEVFVKATYNLEGDGSLSFTAYEIVQTVVAAVRAAHTPNTEAVIRSITTQSTAQQRHRSYARSCMQPALDYFQELLDSSLKEQILVFKAVRVFNPHKIVMLKPDVSHVNALQVVPFFKDDELENLKAELPSYVAKADGISDELAALEWWKLNATDLPLWSNAVKKVLTIQPSSAAAERVFSLLNSGFGDLQGNSLKDYMEASIMLRYNH